MWYVIQTKTGEEERIRGLLEKLLEEKSCRKLFVPLSEDVRRSRGEIRIFFRRMFPGYFFVETDDPEEIYARLRTIPEFTRLLGSSADGGSKCFIPVESEEEEFLQSLLDDGIMHVSFISMKNRRIDRITGPLAKYRNHITKLDIPHRRAIVETEMFGKKRKIRFGLWMEGDPDVAWLRSRLQDAPEEALDEGTTADIGLYPGDHVMDETGLYGDIIFVVDSVDPGRRILYTSFEIMGTKARLELSADNVKKVR